MVFSTAAPSVFSTTRIHTCLGNIDPTDQYTDQPKRNPRMMVHCFAPFNAETPHTVLSKVGPAPHIPQSPCMLDAFSVTIRPWL